LIVPAIKLFDAGDSAVTALNVQKYNLICRDLAELSNPSSDKVKLFTGVLSNSLGLAPRTLEVKALSIALGGTRLLNSVLTGTVRPVEAVLEGAKLATETFTEIAKYIGGLETAVMTGHFLGLVFETSKGAYVLYEEITAAQTYGCGLTAIADDASVDRR
jgi:hypothetical protein